MLNFLLGINVGIWICYLLVNHWGKKEMKCLFHKWKTVAESPKWKALQCEKCGKIKWIEKFYGGYQPRPRLPWEPEESKEPPCNESYKKKGKEMKKVQIILKNGTEVTFQAENNFSLIECTNHFIYHSPDGNEYGFCREDISAEIITPMVKCPKCGEWIVPEKKMTFMDSRLNRLLSSCPKCGEEIET